MALPAKKDDGVDLAVIMGGAPKKGGHMMGPHDMGDEEAEEGHELSPAFMTAAEEAMNAELPMEDRAHALKAAIKACLADEEY